MSSFLPGRRRAEQFAQAVEGTRTTRDPRVTQLLEVVDRVRRPAAIEPSEEFSADLRARLIAEASAISEATAASAEQFDAASARAASPGDGSAGGPGTPGEPDPASGSGGHGPHGHRHRAKGSRRLPTRPRTRILAATTAITLVAGMFGIVSFTRQAMPGETLYGLKRSLEETQVVIATNSESRGRHYLSSGRARLSELDSLINSGPAATPAEPTEQTQDRNRTQPTDNQQETTDESDSQPEPQEQQSEIDSDRVALARDTLRDFARQTEQGGALLLKAYEDEHQRASLEKLQQFTEESSQELATLAPHLPEELGDSFTEATRVLYELDEQIGGFCADCVSLTPSPEPSPTPSEEDRTNTPSPTPTSPSPTPSESDSEEPSPEPTDSPTRQPEDPSPSPRAPDEDEDETDNPLPLPTELPLPLF